MKPVDRKLKVFLCHATQDKPIVRELYQRLSTEPWIDPWLDDEKLLPGMDWNLEIEKAVETSDAVIVCLSKNAVNKEGYIQKEIKKALDISEQKPEGMIFIIPARLEECNVPRRLNKWQRVDLFEQAGYEKLKLSLLKRSRELGVSMIEQTAGFDQIHSTNTSSPPLVQRVKQPVIQAQNPIVEPKKFVGDVWQNGISIEIMNVSPGTLAEKVFPTISWYTMDGKLVTENHGRWWISNEDLKSMKTRERQVMDLPSNGMSFRLHFAIQAPGQQDFSAWWRDTDGTYKLYPLPEQKYKVKVHCQSNEGIEADFEYIVANDNGVLSIKEIEK